ncbi:MAG: hypothetical protein DI533_14125 [Cereibacter sphaeroides]|uniref:Uncharacterized protein n=1 Tax=Cereibacter sphaeroides TaxID=1063 RepID=A0A2W5U0N7_CERSP|nr:MAG: hypothetical protein DI533_14125 [Cereibacter sphaeroides]
MAKIYFDYQGEALADLGRRIHGLMSVAAILHEHIRSGFIEGYECDDGGFVAKFPNGKAPSEAEIRAALEALEDAE